MVERPAGSEDRSVSDLASLPDSITRHRVLGPKDTSAFLGLTVSQLRRMRVDEILPRPIQFSERRYGWRIGDLIDWLSAGAPDGFDRRWAEMDREFGPLLRMGRPNGGIAAIARRSMAA
jgi:hypothetical protein